MEIATSSPAQPPRVAYAGPATPRVDRGSAVGRAVLIGLNGTSLLASGLLATMLGNSYGPMFGLIVGLPLTALTGIGVTLPSVVFGLRRPVGHRGILWLGVASAAVGAAVTALLICLPHGGGC